VSGTASKAGLDGKGAGTIDKLDEKLDEHRKELGLETLECWWRDDIDARVNLLDTSTLFHFAAMLSGADALRLLAEVQTDAAVRNELASLLRRVISAQWTQDFRVKFKQAELDNDSLEALFVDVRATATSPRGPRTTAGIAVTGDGQNDARQVGGAVAYLAQSSFPFTLVRGEPGQGKSTMGQYLAQVYRSEFVTDTAPGTRPTISSASSRVPLRIDLRDYASWLNGEDPFADGTGRPPKSPKPRARGDIERFLQLLLADLCVADTVSLTTIHDFLAKMLQGDPQRPQAAVAADHRRRGGQQQPVAPVERLRVKPRHPVDGVLEHAWHRRVVLRRGDHEPVAQLQAPAKLVGPRRKPLAILDVRVVGRAIELADRRHVDLALIN
jgi:hypothetical protein